MTPLTTDSLHKAILDNLPIGVFTLDQDYSVTAWNATLEKWTGIHEQDIIGKSAACFFPDLEKRAGFEQIEQIFHLETVIRNFSGQLEQMLPTAPDSAKDLNLHASIVPISTGQKKQILVALQNKSSWPRLPRHPQALSVQTTLHSPHHNSKEDQLQLAASVFSNTTIGILVTDSRGVILSVNPAFEEITGYRECDAVGITPRFLKSGIHDPGYYSGILRKVFNAGEWKGEIWVRRKNGEIFPQDTTIAAIRDDNGNILKYSAILSDITERKKEEEHLRFLSMRDGLTGLFNRRTFDEELENEWRRALRVSAPFSLIMLDIDFFKSYNDCYGHHQGDKCLKAVAGVIHGSVHRKGDLTARYGGEEFVIMLPSSSKSDALFIAETIRNRIANLKLPHKSSPRHRLVTASLGIGTLVPTLNNSPAKLLQLADKALYAAKSQGRNRVVSYVEEGIQLQLLP